jgi:HK97 family phage portal protein
MNIFDRVAKRLGYVKTAELKKVAPFLLAHAENQRWNIPEGEIYENQSSLYSRSSWVHTAIKHPASIASTTPVGIKRRIGEKLEDIENHPFELLLEQPNPLQSRFELLEATYAYSKLTGNVYWWLNRRSNKVAPAEVWLLPSHLVEPIPDGSMFLKGYKVDPANGQKPFFVPLHQMMHLKAFNSLSMFVGLSAMEPISPAASGDIAQQQHSLKFFKKEGGRMPGVLSFQDMIQNDMWAEVRKEFRDHAAKEQFMLLRGIGEKAVNWTPMEISRKEMQFIEAREFSRNEIYDLLAPGLTSILDPSANVASGRIGKEALTEYAVYPFHQQLSARITSDILPAYGDNLMCEFEDVRIADRAMELKEQETAFKIMTVNEIRERFWDLEPISDERGDKLVDGPGETPQQFQSESNKDKDRHPMLEGSRDNSRQDGNPDNDDDALPAKAKVIEVQPTKSQKMRDELEQWQRFVYKRIKAGKSVQSLRDFEAEHIPASLKGAIEGALEAIEGAEDVKSVFSDAIAWQGYPSCQI